ncbi:MAG: mevalonate kinase [Myxococcaceae bacterium]
MPSASAAKGFGPGKIILLGEHGVVYGHPALVGPLAMGVTATSTPSNRCAIEPPKNLTTKQKEALLAAFERLAKRVGRPPVRVAIDSALPVSVGLGSSAALSVSCARVLFSAAGKTATSNEIVAAALEMEKEFHGTPSGVDHTCSALGALIEYRKKPGATLGKVRKLVSPKPLRVLVAVAGARTGTKATVAALRERQATWKMRYSRLFEEIAAVVQEGSAAVESGDLASLGDAMNVNHGLLSALGLSSSPLDALVYKLRAEGALGAKLTGAGGDGGAVIGLFENPTPVVAKLQARGIECFASQLAGPIPL